MKRRKFIQTSALTAFSISTFGAINWNGKTFQGNTPTTTDILGPFYRPGSPLRTNLIPTNSKGEVLNLTGVIYKKDGVTPMSNSLIEIWQCDENAHYDNTSDEYLFRGSFKTENDGKYKFKTIMPIPYKGDDWRPAHIHMRISSADHQDLITQIYFKGDPYVKTDPAASKLESLNRVLDIEINSSNEKAINFDVVMGKSFLLANEEYKKITGIYQLNNGMAEFSRQDDLLILKINGQILEGMVYKGNNLFEGGLGFNKAQFELLANGDVKTNITMWDSWSDDNSSSEVFKGIKVLKYND